MSLQQRRTRETSAEIDIAHDISRRHAHRKNMIRASILRGHIAAKKLKLRVEKRLHQDQIGNPEWQIYDIEMLIQLREAADRRITLTDHRVEDEITEIRKTNRAATQKRNSLERSIAAIKARHKPKF